jgi:flagellar FliJ protein
LKFKFGYEKLLEFYEQQEEIAQRDYNESLSHLDLEKVKHKAMWTLVDTAEDEIYNLKASPKGSPMARLTQLDSFISGQKIRIEKQREVIINHTSIVEQKQEILIAAVREKKTIEKLKEKKLREFKKLQNKKELKANDEFVVTRFKRGEDR